MQYLIFLRLLHIVCAVIWTGGMIYQAVFVIPAAKTLGSDGTKFIHRLSNTNKLPVIMAVSGTLTIITGILLMKRLFGGLQLALFNSTHGALILIGALLALIGFVTGLSVMVPAARRMSAIVQTVAAAGSQPNPGQVAELQKLRNRSFAATNFVAMMLFSSLVLMSMLKYL